MEIVCDTREQDPLKFRKEYTVIREKLDSGDYGCKINGSLIPVVFERKNIGDLYSTLSGGYERFKREINRATASSTILVLTVECPLTTVTKGYKHSSRSPKSLIKQCFTLMVRHRVPCLFFTDRHEMAEYITQVFLAFEREYEKDRKTDKRRTAQEMAT